MFSKKIMGSKIIVEPSNKISKINQLTLTTFPGNTIIIIFSLIIAVFVCLIQNYILYGIAMLIAGVLVYNIGKSFLFGIIIIILLTAINPDITGFRAILNILSISVLFYFFIREYGFKFSEYPSLPIEVKYLGGMIIITLIISTIASGMHVISLIALVRSIIFYFVCYIFYSNITAKSTIYYFYYSLIAASFIVSLSIYYDLFQSGLVIFLAVGQLARYAGEYGNPNYVGLLVFITTTMLISILINKHKVGNLFLLWAMLINNIIILVIINSRASVISTILSVSFILLVHRRKLFFKISIFVLILSVVLLLLPPVQEFLSIFTRLETLGEREYFWDSGIAVIKDYPIFGVGPDLFVNHFFNYLPSSADYLFKMASVMKPHPHNFFLFFTAENGLMGLLSSFLIFIIYFYIGFMAIKISQEKDYDYYLISTAMTSIGLGIFIRAFFEVDGIMSYGYITRDLPFGLSTIILFFIYNRLKGNHLIKADHAAEF
ncbi:MAG: O-antigen ligase family protein [Ignavibacteriaceae bacterium]|nr:O-antigen ligase family protein [Ignavibacteriaceae bacterium]